MSNISANAVQNQESTLDKVLKIREELKKFFLEREEEIDAVIMAVLAQQHLLMIGPPGTAKSQIVREVLIRCLDQDVNTFDYTMSSHTTPQQLFGGVPLEEMKKGSQKRNIANKLPVTDVAFLDEVLKAKKALLDGLLTVLNERLYNDDGARKHIPLMTVFGASNEYPDWGNDGEKALYDRFLLRFHVERIKEDNNFLQMLNQNGTRFQAPALINRAELVQAQQEVEAVTVPSSIKKEVVKMRADLLEDEIFPSDRRYQDGMKLVRAHAYLNGRKSATKSDLLVYKNILWDDPEDKKSVAQVVRESCLDKVQQQVEDEMRMAREVHKKAVQTGGTEAGMEGHTKIKEIKGNLLQIQDSEGRDITSELEEINELLKEISKVNLGIDF